jgi:hypothetical protein
MFFPYVTETGGFLADRGFGADGLYGATGENVEEGFAEINALVELMGRPMLRSENRGVRVRHWIRSYNVPAEDKPGSFGIQEARNTYLRSESPRSNAERRMRDSRDGTVRRPD